jgi:hypothetical protein
MIANAGLAAGLQLGSRTRRRRAPRATAHGTRRPGVTLRQPRRASATAGMLRRRRQTSQKRRAAAHGARRRSMRASRRPPGANGVGGTRRPRRKWAPKRRSPARYGPGRPCMDGTVASACIVRALNVACSCHRHLLGPRRWAAMRCTHRRRSTLWCVSAPALWPSVRHGVQLREAVCCWDIRASLLVPQGLVTDEKLSLSMAAQDYICGRLLYTQCSS